MNAVKHEWGHNVQAMLVGLPKYVLGIAIPSVINYLWGSGHYYSKPWERTADWFGGANNGPYDEGSLAVSILYLLGLMVI